MAVPYPDLDARCKPKARLKLTLRDLLEEKTDDKHWPPRVNDRSLSRLLLQNLDGTLRAYEQLHKADPQRFTDSDLYKIVLGACLDIPNTTITTTCKELLANSTTVVSRVPIGQNVTTQTVSPGARKRGQAPGNTCFPGIWSEILPGASPRFSTFQPSAYSLSNKLRRRL